MIKLIASDLDGTLLLNGSQKLARETCGLIEKLMDRGIIFVPASGRQYANMQRMFAPVADRLGFICENGCLSFFQGKMLHKDVMDRETGQELLHAIWEKEGAEILLSGVNTSYLMPKEESYLHRMRDIVKNNVTVVDDIFAVEEEYFKISVYEKAGVDASCSYWENRFGSRVQAVVSGLEWLDFTPKGVHKGRALRVLQEYLGIAPEECMAFGDNYNDKELLESVGYPVAMENAKPEIYAMCQNHTERVERTLRELLAGI